MTAPNPASAPAMGRRSLVSLVADLPRILSELVRAEIESLQTELAGKAKKAGLGAGLIVGAAAVLFFALGVFIAAAIAGLATVLPIWASALIIGGSLVLVAAILVLIGVTALKRAMPPKPEKTIASVEEDIRTIKGIERD